MIQRIGVSEEPVTVFLSTHTGTASSTWIVFKQSLYIKHTSGSDFIEVVNRPITFGTSDFERRVQIQTNADSIVEGTEMFTASLMPVSDRVVITEDTADITIEETANGKFTVWQANSSGACRYIHILSLVV